MFGEYIFSKLSMMFFFSIVTQKRKVGTIAPKKFIARLRKEKIEFDNYMQQVKNEMTTVLCCILLNFLTIVYCARTPTSFSYFSSITSTRSLWANRAPAVPVTAVESKALGRLIASPRRLGLTKYFRWGNISWKEMEIILWQPGHFNKRDPVSELRDSDQQGRGVLWSEHWCWPEH